MIQPAQSDECPEQIVYSVQDSTENGDRFDFLWRLAMYLIGSTVGTDWHV
jgi:hypothetical protein